MSNLIGICYECEKEDVALVWKSRCCNCVIDKLEFNIIENDKLRHKVAEKEAMRLSASSKTLFAYDLGYEDAEQCRGYKPGQMK